MIKVMTDTGGGLSQALTAQHDIQRIPLLVMFGTDTLRDGVDISSEAFLQRLKTSKEFPKTSQPPVGDFATAFKQQLDAGHDVLCITISSLLSGTYNSAATARQQLGDEAAGRIALVDSKSAATGQALIVLEAARLAHAGQPLPDILARLRTLIAGMRLELTVDTLEYFVKGGRLSGAQGFVGTLLQLKPVLTIRDCRLEPLERIRTKAKAVARLYEIADATLSGKRGARIGVLHAGIPAEAEAMAARLRDAYRPEECVVLDLAPAVSAHTGPGAIGIAYYAD